MQMDDIKHTKSMSSDVNFIRTVALYLLVIGKLKAQGMRFKKNTTGLFFQEKPVNKTIHYYDSKIDAWVYEEKIK